MIELLQLKDGSYKLVVKYQNESIKIDQTWYFAKADASDAEE